MEMSNKDAISIIKQIPRMTNNNSFTDLQKEAIRCAVMKAVKALESEDK